MFGIYSTIEDLFIIVLLCMVVLNLLLRMNKNEDKNVKEYFVDDLEFWQDYKSEKKSIERK